MLKSLQSKLISVSLLAIFVATAVGFYLTVLEHRRVVSGYVSESLEITTKNLSEALVEPLATNAQVFELTTLLLPLENQDDIRFARIYDSSGQMLAQYVDPYQPERDVAKLQSESGTISKSELLGMLGSRSVNGGVEVVEMVGTESVPLGYIWLFKDTKTPLDASVEALLQRALPLVVALLTLVLLFYLFFQRRLLRPLIALTEFTRSVNTSKDYSKRSEIRGDDEVATLSTSLNDLLFTIEKETQTNIEVTESLLEHKNRLEQIANRDSLTGLPNRQYFLHQLEQSLATKRESKDELIIMFFDLDGFKEVNDGFGHEFGDHLLVEVGKRVKQHVRGQDLLARLGGDEFTILLREDATMETASCIAKRVVEAMEHSLFIDGWEINVGVSMGIVKASDADYEMNTFLAFADIAMYRSKALGKGRYTFFDQQMLADNKRKLTVASSIESALENSEFQLYYQPKVDELGALAGLEALIRWNSQAIGWVSPAEFIPIAEQSGKIRKITQWVLNRACQDLLTINTLLGYEIKVSVNLSTIDLTYDKMADTIRDACNTYAVSPSQFEFEVTESAYLKNFDDAEQFFNQIREMGSSIALDDFGTGYSSLGYLTQISIDTLKIDKQFIDAIESDSRSRIVINTIIAMAKGLGLKICAEGVENHEQKRYLLDQHVDTLQGYLFSKPLPMDALADLVSELKSNGKHHENTSLA